MSKGSSSSVIRQCVLFGIAVGLVAQIQTIGWLSRVMPTMEAYPEGPPDEASRAAAMPADPRGASRPVVRNSEPPLSLNMTGRTKIIGLSDYGYRQVAQLWYDRLAELGYTTHHILAVDQRMADHLQARNDARGCDAASALSMNRPDCTRFDTMIVPRPRNLDFFRTTMFTVRWRYIMENLQRGVHILQSDVDAIFNRYVPMSVFEDDPFRPDALAAHSMGYPYDLLQEYGFTFTCGLTWWRATERTVQAVKMFQDRCGERCDDQVEWNNVLHVDLDMDWERDPSLNNTENRRYYDYHTAIDPITGNKTEYWTRYSGESNNPAAGALRDVLPGVSRKTGLRFRVWSRDFAWRGRNGVKGICPDRSVNWVAMPYTWPNETVQSQANRRVSQYQTWNSICSGYPDDGYGQVKKPKEDEVVQTTPVREDKIQSLRKRTLLRGGSARSLSFLKAARRKPIS